MEPIRDNLIRATFPGAELRAEADEAPRLIGHFARFNEWNRIDSVIEGRFLERIDPAAFTKTLATRTPKILFNHGKDPEIGDKVIASRGSFPVDDIGPGIDAELLEGLPPLVVSGLRAGEYGMSYRFSIPTGGDFWDRSPKRSDYNPDALPERTIREAIVFEAGPVTWPADAGTDAAVRSMTDAFSPPAPVAPAIPATRKVTPVSNYHSRDEKATRAVELAQVIARQAVEYPGVMPADVQAEYDANKEERKTLIADIAAWDKRQADLVDIAKDENRTETFSVPTVTRQKAIEDIYDIRSVDQSGKTPEQRSATLRDNAMRSLDSSYVPKGANVDGLVKFLDNEQFDEDEYGNFHQEATRRILLTGKPEYRRAFAKYLKQGNDRGFTPEEARAAALAVTGTTTTGGFAVPYIFDPTFIHIGAHTSVNPYRAACRVETISGGNNWRAVTATAITAKWDAEAAASVEGGPTIGQPAWTVQRADAFATVSIETLQDRPDVTEELSNLFGEAKDTLEENSFTLGTGATVYPFGMFRTLAFTAKATATNDVTVLLDAIAVEGDLPIRHRMAPGCAWFFARSTQRQLELLDTGGYYFKRVGQNYALGSAIPANSATGNTGTQLLGYPIWEVPSAVSTLTTDASQIAVFGDPKNYVIVDRIGMNVEVVPTMLNGATPSFPTGQRGIYCYWRSTARPANVDGMRQLVVA